MNLPRPEHPRPSCRREQWQNLNGEWAFEIDNDRRPKFDTARLHAIISRKAAVEED